MNVLTEEDVKVLERMKAALPDVGLNGWATGVKVLEKLLAMLDVEANPVYWEVRYQNTYHFWQDWYRVDSLEVALADCATYTARQCRSEYRGMYALPTGARQLEDQKLGEWVRRQMHTNGSIKTVSNQDVFGLLLPPMPRGTSADDTISQLLKGYE